MSDKVNFSAAERESGLGRIKERLDKVRALIQEPEFLEGKGLSNEVNIRIFCYEPENEMVVRHFGINLTELPRLYRRHNRR